MKEESINNHYGKCSLCVREGRLGTIKMNYYDNED